MVAAVPFTPAPAVTATAGPAEPVPVALLMRVSTTGLQDPLASLRRQIDSAREWLPAGWIITGIYWDVESGGIKLEERSQGEAWEPFAAAGIPRDGGIEDLLAEARSPSPRFAAVVVEDIERSARSMFNSLKLEDQLEEQGILIFATDEQASIEGVNSTTILIRRVKQGVAEWLRLQIKEKAWKGLRQHTLDGWNIGPAPYGYLPERVPHPVPIKASQGRTKTRLVLDPPRGPVVTQIFTWRVTHRLSVPTITWRLNLDPGRYPAPRDETGWTENTVAAMLRNPKYTGHMVYGRTRKTRGRKRGALVDPAAWIWSPEPTHAPLVTKQMWDAAQTAGAEHGNVRDPEKPTSQPGRRYVFRSRVRCNDCQHRMQGLWRTAPRKNDPGRINVYYKCPHKPSNPRQAAARPHHPPSSVSVREDLLLAAITSFLDDYVLGHDRAAHLTARMPVTAADQASQRAAATAAAQAEITRTGTAQAGLITELEALGADTSPAANAYRARIRERFTQLHDQRTAAETQLASLQGADEPVSDPALLDELPYLPGILRYAPEPLIERLLAALDVQCLYRKNLDQVTIWAAITDTTPRTLAALLADPRTDNDTATTPQQPAAVTAAPENRGELAQGPI
jgi:site-specific DNA recombinase